MGFDNRFWLKAPQKGMRSSQRTSGFAKVFFIFFNPSIDWEKGCHARLSNISSRRESKVQ